MLLLIANKVTYHSTEITGMYEEVNTTRNLSNRLPVKKTKINFVIHTEHVHEFLPNSM